MAKRVGSWRAMVSALSTAPSGMRMSRKTMSQFLNESFYMPSFRVWADEVSCPVLCTMLESISHMTTSSSMIITWTIVSGLRCNP